MKHLIPTALPGSTRRKARAFAGEIARLHREGYTLEVIRQTLADAGVHVSWSTVQREAQRAGALPHGRKPAETPPTALSATPDGETPRAVELPSASPAPNAVASASSEAPGNPTPSAPPSLSAQSRQRAAEFVQQHFTATNPLMNPRRNNDENRGP